MVADPSLMCIDYRSIARSKK